MKDFLASIISSGLEPEGYHAQWRTNSGVNAKSGVCVEHGFLISALFMQVTYDRLDVYNIATTELLARRVLMIERAVKRNARQPDFEGLEAVLETCIDESGGLLLPKLDAWVGEQQRAEAQVLKAGRQWREETRGGQQLGGGRGKGRKKKDEGE